MSGPFRFVFMIVWIAIGMSTLGTLKDCTMQVAGMAVQAQRYDVISLKALNASFMGHTHGH